MKGNWYSKCHFGHCTVHFFLEVVVYKVKWCWVHRDRVWLPLLPALLCWYWHTAWSGLEQTQELQVDVFIFIAAEAVARDPSKIPYGKKSPQTTLWTSPWNINPSNWLDIWVIYNGLIYIVPFRSTAQYAAQYVLVSWPSPAVQGTKNPCQRRTASDQISTRKESLSGLGAALRLGDCPPGMKTQMWCRI